MKTYLATILFLLSTSIIIASPDSKAEIEGIISDKISKKPVEYANIILFNSTDSSMITGTISSEDGQFSISSVEKGNYYLKIDFLGYHPLYIPNIYIESRKQILDVGTIYLNPGAIDLEEAEVVSSTDYISFKIDKKVVQVSDQIIAEGGAVVDALVNVPSVEVDASGNVSLRGSTNFTLLIDGRPSILNPSDALNQIQSAQVDKIEIITNPGAKYEANGTSGIINLLMKKQKKKA